MKIRYLLVTCLLVLASGAAHGLGLGEIQVNSRLNQPLDARIAIQEAFPGEADQLTIQTASAEDFARVGLERTRLPVTLRFEIEEDPRGGKVVKVTSTDPVREPYLGVLLEASWSGGRLLREYGVLLDPPVSAEPSRIVRVDPPSTAPAPAAPPPAAPPAPAAALPEPARTAPLEPEAEAIAVEPSPPPSPPPAEPVPAPAAAPAPAAPVAEAAPRSPPPPGFAPSAAPPAPAATAADDPPASVPLAADGTYIVQEGDTLSAIAYRLAAEQRVHTSQMMLALQRDNADAFFADNINALKAGAVLRVPETDRIRSLARAEAEQEVRRQLDAWDGGNRAMALADPGRAPVTAGTTTRTAAAPTQARVELLSPRREDEPGGATPGASGSQTGGADMAAVQADLNRAREELSSREREVAELSSRVQDLEEINSQNSRLLELKDAEVAALQRRLAELTEAAEAGAALAETPPAAADGDAPLTGDLLALDRPDSVDTGAGTGDAPDGGTDAGSEEDGELASVEEGVDTAGSDADAPAPGEAMDEDDWAAAATASPADPFADEATPDAADEGSSWSAGTASDADSAPAVDVTASAAPAVASTSQTLEPAGDAPAEAFYKNPLLWGAGLIVLALVLLFVLLSRRRSGEVVAAAGAAEGGKRSVSELFASDAPQAPVAAADADSRAGAEAAAAEAAEDAELRELIEQVRTSPDDYDSYVELLSIYYANQDREQFLAWAEELHQRIDHDSAEWQQVVVMGRELTPQAALFTETEASTSGIESLEVDDAPVETPVAPEVDTAPDTGWTPPWSAGDAARTDSDVSGHKAAADDSDVLDLDDGPDPLAGSAPAASESPDLAPLDMPEPDPEPLRFDVDSDAGTGVSPGDPDADAATGLPGTAAGSDWELKETGDEPAPERSAADSDALADPGTIEFEPMEPDPAPVDAGQEGAPSATGLAADESTQVELPPLEFDDEEEAMPGNVVDIGEVSGGDEATTKLELARAYMDMGDPDGAKAMLEEVLGEGDTAQREEARRLLERL